MENVLSYFMEGILSLTWKECVMYAIGIILIYLAVAKNYEPMLLLPIGFSTILVNLPFSIVTGTAAHPGALQILFDAGIMTELFPLLIFIGVGAMIDFRPLLERPWLLIFGIVAHSGIFIAAAIAHYCFGFDVKEALSIGTIGAADGPTAIVVASKHAPHLLGQITVVAYSYMSLVPIIMGPVIKLLTTKNERKMVEDLLALGKNVEIIPRSNELGVKTPDFLVDGIKTELKTMEGSSLNTPVSKIQKAFKQDAEVVIIDGRITGLTLDQANTIIKRILGIYGGELPGIVEIWTTEGIIRR